MANIVGDLAPLKWRGLAAPCESAHYHGAHSQAKRLYPYIDAAGHDGVGRDSYAFQPTRLHFNNTIEPDLYPGRWNEFREALENPAAGDLDHPDLGSVRAVVLTWDVALNAQNRGGVVVDVVWEETVDNLDERVVYLGPDVSPAAVAEAADSAMAELGIEYPDGTGDTSFTEAIKSIEGFAFSTQLSVSGYINQVVGAVEETISTAEALHDHAAWALRDNLVLLWNGLKKMGQQVASVQRATSVHQVLFDTTLDALARKLGNTVQELIGLNLSLLRSPTVPKGTKVKYFANGLSIDSPLRPPGP